MHQAGRDPLGQPALIGGALLSAGIAFPWGCYVFAVVGALGALALAVTRGVAGARRRLTGQRC